MERARRAWIGHNVRERSSERRITVFQARRRALGEHPLVGEARGVGLIWALELVADKAAKTSFEMARDVGALYWNHCRERGLIARGLGDSIALCPPLVITEAQVDALFTKLAAALDDTLASIRNA